MSDERLAELSGLFPEAVDARPAVQAGEVVRGPCPLGLCDGSGFLIDEATNTASDCGCRAGKIASSAHGAASRDGFRSATAACRSIVRRSADTRQDGP